jgi:hypothetical protein
LGGGGGPPPPQAAPAPNLPSEVRAPSHNAYVLRGQGHKEHLLKILDKDSIPAIEPLKVAKADWAKGKYCTKNHSVKPT